MAVVSFETLGDLEDFLGAEFETDTQFQDFYNQFEGDLQVRDFEESEFGWIGQLYASRDDSFEDATFEQDSGDVLASDFGQTPADDLAETGQSARDYYDTDLEIAQAMVEDGLDIFAIAKELEFPEEYAQTLAMTSGDDALSAEEIVNGFYNLMEQEIALDEMTGDDLNTGEETALDAETKLDDSAESESGTELNQQGEFENILDSLFGNEWKDIKNARHLREMDSVMQDYNELETPALSDTLKFVGDLGEIASMDDFLKLALEALFL